MRGVQHWTFAPPPDWPPPPPGWRPPDGWQPDPTWGPVPPGWRLWEPVPPPPRPRRTAALGVVTLVALVAAAVVIPRQHTVPTDTAGHFGIVGPVGTVQIVPADPVPPIATPARDHPEPSRTKRTVALKQRQAEARARHRAILEQHASAPPVRSFADCAALNSVYPHGLGLPTAADDVRADPSTRPVTGFGRSVALYTANRGLDRDHDGIACEHE